MRLIDMENQIKQLIDEDVKNPEIYNKIYDLSIYYLRWKKAVPEQDMDGVASVIAEELYLKVYNGGTIISWLGYINRFYHAAIRVHRKLNSSELIDTTNDYDLAQSIISMCSSENLDEYQRVLDDIYLDSLPEIIDEIMDESRYNKDTKDYLNAKLSVLLSLCSSKFINYNLSKSEEMYVRMLYNLAKDKIVKNIQTKSSNYNNISSMDLLQLFTLSNANISE